MTEDEAKQIAGYVINLSESQRYRATVQAVAGPALKVLGLLALVSVALGLVLNGTAFFTKSVPAGLTFVAKRVLLGDNFRPFLIERAAREMAYGHLCIGRNQAVDFDGDGDATDLIVEFYPSPSGCSYGSSSLGSTRDAVYAMLKEVEWKGLWPTYSLLRVVDRNTNGYPTAFDMEGPFLIGSIQGTDFLGNVIYGYANGTLHPFGQFRAIVSSLENAPARPRSQIGNRLFLFSEEGLMSFEVTPAGDFLSRRMSAQDIVDRNNAALVLEDGKKLESGGGPPPGNEALYQAAKQTVAACDLKVFLNGKAIVFESEAKGICIARTTVARTATIVANVPCRFTGFVQAEQFPWGKVYDPQKKEHRIQCPVEGKSGGHRYELIVGVE